MEAMFLIERYHSIRKDTAAFEAELKHSENILERLEAEGQVGVVLYRYWIILAKEISPGSSYSPNSSQLNMLTQNTKIFTGNPAIVS